MTAHTKELPTAGQIIDSIRGTLGCSQRVVAKLAGVVPNTLSNNREKPISEVSRHTARRLTNLYNVVSRFEELRPEVIFEIIQAHVYADLEDRIDSVVSAIQQDKYSPQGILRIAELSYNRFQKQKQEKRTIKLPDEFSLPEETVAAA